MGKLIATEFMSVDGVMEAPDQWHFPFFTPEMGQFKVQELWKTDALLLGRVTYESFAGAWPNQPDDDPFAAKFNSMPKYAVSTTLDSVDWNNTHLIKEDVADEVRKLKSLYDQDIAIHGSAQLVNSLAKEDLIDEYRLMIHPIVVGHGKHLFQDGLIDKPLKLIDSIFYDNGAMVLTYEPVR